MKKLVLSATAIAFSFFLQAQINTPAPSPFSKTEQKVGLTDVTLEYSRPSMRGRTIFGGLEEYGELWRTGANARTKITFSDDVTVDGQQLKAGSYSIYTKPGQQSWEVFFYTEADGGGYPQQWDDSKVAAKTTVETFQLPVDIETFTITFDDLTSNSANLGIMWERTYVAIPIEFPTDKKVMESIESAMSGSPKANDYYAAATYYFSEGKDVSQADKWMDKAMEMTEEPAFWQLRQQSLIKAKAGDKKGAIKAAKASLAKAKEAGNDDYVKMNTASLQEWGAK
ncbi:DUF2911 domain-containing protein [Euzebyella marina]|uniref:DUF2911 domain-containing protein n=1 Tax=Euzebyella marina TaxID=1761453 RepID=A0A3G2L7V3_9FLAO|nr:DUF2911 domain-containing protein [Euzebyella marina]AYN68330.1 DUF2911 domain-containing protein [Euzebyella marina]MAU72880.1 dihydrolipoamide dehydrogenase [Pseudozobellia sp.]MBG50595.1 dihydrolipoamide dehydrogenase [Pseudozobellia sp.]|tara:strand:- start:113067 stop:113915 length:849 start_codon:yes stop_codon:yes gene_type:complete